MPERSNEYGCRGTADLVEFPDTAFNERNYYVDPAFLDNTTYAGALAWFAAFSGLGILATGIGSYFYQKGRAEELRATGERGRNRSVGEQSGAVSESQEQP